MPVTVVIPTLNEGHRIGELVRALAWAAEVIVVDGGSADATRAEAEAAGARVLELRGGTIGAQRNAGADAARTDWILALDADERPAPGLAAELAGVLDAPAADAYRVRCRVLYLGREVTWGRWARDWHVRLYRRPLRFTGTAVHEKVDPPGPVGTLRETLLHEPYADVSHHVRKMATYTRWGAEDLRRRGRRASGWQLVTRPVWRFLREYVGYGAWRAGRLGLLTAGMGAVTAFLKYAQLLGLELAEEAKRREPPRP